jgi:hypothetical protein
MHMKNDPRSAVYIFIYFQDMLHNLCFIFPQYAVHFIILSFSVQMLHFFINSLLKLKYQVAIERLKMMLPEILCYFYFKC